MPHSSFSIREMQSSDIPLIVRYWLESDPAFLEGMGVDLSKLPRREDFHRLLAGQLENPIEEKQSYCLIWQVEGMPAGHSNTNPTHFGEEAYMHLHLWDGSLRGKGYGTDLVRLCIHQFFDKLQLKRLICQPYALNPAPNKTLEKVGFEFVREYTTVPGSINFEQPVKRWEMSLDRYRMLMKE